jgi:hypothetical protein
MLLLIERLGYCGDRPACQLTFTFYWPTADRWEAADFDVQVTAPPR